MASNTAAVEGLSGALGGVSALLATYPLMTIQTLQATRRSQSRSLTEQTTLTVPIKRQKGTLADVAEVISQSGWAGLYRGLKPALVGTTVSQGIYFYLYSILRQAALKQEKRRGRGKNGEIGVGFSLVVAFLAGCGNVLLTNPIWVVATRMQAQQKATKEEPGAGGPLAVAKEIMEESGVKGLWKGVLPSLIMVVNPTVNYMLYESFTAQLNTWKRNRLGKAIAPSAGDVFAVSAAAKLGATVATYPLQLIKARLQSAGRHTHAERQYSGTLNAILRIWKTEGPLGFYKGMHTKIVQSILAAALLMAIKEKMTQAALLLLKAPRPPSPQKSLTLTVKAA